MTFLMLVNGPPGAGKSTMAEALAQERPMTLALDIDVLKHALSGWQADPEASGVQARRLAVAVVSRHLRDGHAVVLGQYLARTGFIEELEQVARDCGAEFIEAVLLVDPDTLAGRLRARRAAPDRPEHMVNNRLVSPDEADRLVASMSDVLDARPRAHRIYASGTAPQTLSRLCALLPG